MKKFGIITLLTASFFLLSCSGSNGNQGGEKNSSASAQTVKDDSSVKPEHLTAATFKQKVMDYDKNPTQWVYEGDKPCIVDFYADWCRPCKMISPILEELSNEYKDQIIVYKVDTDAEKELASVFGITSLPTVVFIPVNGNPSAQKGALPKEAYKQIIDEFLLKKQAPVGEVINK
jgi:thioredoxin